MRLKARLFQRSVVIYVHSLTHSLLADAHRKVHTDFYEVRNPPNFRVNVLFKANYNSPKQITNSTLEICGFV